MANLEKLEKNINVLAPWFNIEKDEHYKLYKELFPENLYQLTELSIAPSSKSIGILVTGKDEEYIKNLITYMKHHNVCDYGINMFNELTSLLPDVKIFFKTDFSSDGEIKLSSYHQGFVPHDAAVDIMAKLNIDITSIRYFFEEVSFLLRNEKFYMGFNYRPDGKIYSKIYFFNSIGKYKHAICPGIAALMGKMKFSSKLISMFVDFHNYLATDERRNVFFSVIFTDKLEPLIRPYYENVPVEKALELYKLMGVSVEDMEHLKICAMELNMERLTYLGVRFVNNTIPSFKSYFMKRYGLEDDPSNLSEFLRDCIWE